ncbi:glutamate-5-semialdehyde dehydrogenase [Candidatus Peregrinibacteria bacterium]|nr:glutamate-5-semialdehyde dehydrogenase [Candidatus Peregrinibacteria bacterium]
MRNQAQSAKMASTRLALLSTKEKNQALRTIADRILYDMDAILEANREDIARGEKKGLGAMLDRLKLDEKRVRDIAKAVRNVANLPDPVGVILEDRVLPNKIQLQRVRVPLGVIGAIIESRPNVTVDLVALCLKSGNAAFIKGGSDALLTNRALMRLIRDALSETVVSEDAVQFLDTSDRSAVSEFLKLSEFIDLMIPRGSQSLVDFVVKNALMPVLGAGDAVVHLYIDEFADMKKALDCAVNSKTRRVSVCNALDTLLVHKAVAEQFFPLMAKQMQKFHVEIRACKRTMVILDGKYDCEKLREAKAKDFDTEFLDYILAVKVVSSFDDALSHIAEHSTRHTDAIITEDSALAQRFLREVDSACVYQNISTAFTDGGEFGLGAEVGIATGKLHARGPFALEGLTTYKWIARGKGQVRK